MGSRAARRARAGQHVRRSSSSPAAWPALLLRLVYGVRFTDMSPFRAIRRDALARLGMRETTYGWNLEMQMRVAAAGLPSLEVPVGQRRRAGGVSKVSGNALAVIKATWSIATTFIRLTLTLRHEPRL